MCQKVLKSDFYSKISMSRIISYLSNFFFELRICTSLGADFLCFYSFSFLSTLFLKSFWNSDFDNFWQTVIHFMQLYSSITDIIGFEPQGWSCKMCESVRLKLGHTKPSIKCHKSSHTYFKTCIWYGSH